MSDFVYLDHSATTPTDSRVVDKMMPYWTQTFGNPSSLHSAGKAAQDALNTACETVAQILNCDAGEVVFTSGGTESNNLALRGVAQAVKSRGRGNHIITTAVEHHAVLDVVKEMGEQGYDVTFLPVDEYGRVSPQQIIDALRPDTIMVSVIYANNEVGTINMITEIGAELKQRRIRFHVDAVQTPGFLPLDIKALNVDMLSLSAHKFYGPKGIGVLYARRALPMSAQMIGGGQQYHRRSGTEPVALIVGLAEALKLVEAEREATVKRLIPMRDHLIQRVLEIIPEAQLTGHPTDRLPGHTSFAVKGLNGDSILLDLNEMGFGASGGSACTTGQQEPSHVLMAMGIEQDRLQGQMRFVMGKHTTQQQIDQFLYHLNAIVERHRVMVPQIS
ncbi:MAG TPA: cysteine desulfurase family protein [Phototrophicaceae bacterium]|jgi:cysteine desulfurase|nr:cysteine desulfurase family protein [Phototrophicaceae bacterium]